MTLEKAEAGEIAAVALAEAHSAVSKVEVIGREAEEEEEERKTFEDKDFQHGDIEEGSAAAVGVADTVVDNGCSRCTGAYSHCTLGAAAGIAADDDSDYTVAASFPCLAAYDSAALPADDDCSSCRLEDALKPTAFGSGWSCAMRN